MEKIKVLIDTDDTIANFSKAVNYRATRNPPEMYEDGFFRNLEPIMGTKDILQRPQTHPVPILYS